MTADELYPPEALGPPMYDGGPPTLIRSTWYVRPATRRRIDARQHAEDLVDERGEQEKGRGAW